MAERKLIRGGWVLTLDREWGELPRGDVMVDGARISAIGRDLPADGAEVIDAGGMIVLPGFIDTHRHAWQSLARATGVDWTLAAYFQAVRGMLGENYRPQDLYTANLLGIVEALDSGITTMLDWSHLINSPEHADAAVAGLKASGSRAVLLRQLQLGVGRSAQPNLHQHRHPAGALRALRLRGPAGDHGPGGPGPAVPLHRRHQLRLGPGPGAGTADHHPRRRWTVGSPRPSHPPAP